MSVITFKQFRVSRGRAVVAIAGVVIVLSALVGAVTTNTSNSSSTFALEPPSRRGTSSGPATTVGSQSSDASTQEGPMGEIALDAPVSSDKTFTLSLPTENAKIIRTGSLTVEVKKDSFDNAYAKASKVAAQYGGYVSASNTSAFDKVETGTLEIRIPSQNFTSAYDAFGELGKVTDRAISGNDVTSQVVDLDARVRTLQAEEDAMRGLLAQAKTTSEILQVRSQLLEVRTQIEQLAAQKANLEQSAAMSSISLTINQAGAPIIKNPKPVTGLAESWADAKSAATNVIGSVVVGLGYVLPVTGLLALAYGFTKLVTRSRRRTAIA